MHDPRNEIMSPSERASYGLPAMPRRRSPARWLRSGSPVLLMFSVLLTVPSTFVAPVMQWSTGAAGTATVHEGPRQVTFVNHMDETIWVAASPGNPPARLAVTGWKLPVGEHVTITVPNHWNARFWGRTGCHFDAAGQGDCQTGDCSGRLQCNGFGAIPVTLAEYDLDAWDNLDFYDVSMVDGSNLPMYINRFGGRGKDAISADGCSAAGCTKAVICLPYSRSGQAEPSSTVSRPAHDSVPTSTVAGENGRARQLATPSDGLSITQRCSRGPSHSPTPTLTTTRRVCSPATGTAITGSPSE